MTKVSTIVKNQFPRLYREESKDLIAFLEAYYEWYETSDRIRSADLSDLRDVDSTVDEFIKYFKNKYLQGLPNLTRGDLRLFIKHSHDLYEAKGTERSIQLLLRLLFNVDSEVYHPGEDVLRASSGVWQKPEYLELTPTQIARSFVNKTVYGATSGASAIVESVVRRIANGVYYDVVFLSSVSGNFMTGERVSVDGDVIDAPIIRGSLNNILITNGGRGNEIGDVFDIVSENGKLGRARVTSVENGTGRVDFELVDGGSGYSMDAEAVVATHMYAISNTSGNGFVRFETVRQKMVGLDVVSANGAFAVGNAVEGYTSGTWIKQASGSILQTEDGQLTVQVENGDFRLADVVRTAGNTVGAIIDTSFNATVTGNVVSSNTSHLGLHDSSGDFILVPGLTKFEGLQSKTTTYPTLRGTGSGASFSIGSIENAETVFLNTDFWNQDNSANVPYLEVGVDGSGSGIGFVDKVVIADTLTISNTAHTFTSGDLVYQANTTTSEIIARGRVHTANTTTIVAFADDGAFVTALPLQKAGSSTPVTNITTSRGSGYANGDVVTFVGGGRSVTSVTVTAGGTGYANGEHVVNTSNPTDENFVAAVVTNASGAVVAINVVESPTYRAAPTLYVVSTSGTGASLVPVLSNPTPAVGYVITNGSGGLVDVSMTFQGSSYFSRPSITFPGGTGAIVSAAMDYGYGLPRNIHGDLYSTINETLEYGTINAGSISSLTGIALGDQYTIDPFVAVVESAVAGLDRRNFVINIANTTGAFALGEMIEQDIIEPASELQFVANSAVSQFRPYEVVYGPTGSALAYSVGPTFVRIIDTDGTFNVGDSIVGATSNAVATVTVKQVVSRLSAAKGEVISANSSVMFVRRTSINTSFELGETLRGRRSGTTAIPVAIEEDFNLEAMGNNAIISATVKTANGIATSVEVFDSGYGYSQGEPVTLISGENPTVITGIASLERQGQSEGFWTSTSGFISNDQYIHDGHYYQAYSYEVRAPYSQERYQDVLKRMVHVAGTAMFGKVMITPEIEVNTNLNMSIEQFESVPQKLLSGVVDITSAVEGEHTKQHINAVLIGGSMSSSSDLEGELDVVAVNVINIEGIVSGVTEFTGTINVG